MQQSIVETFMMRCAMLITKWANRASSQRFYSLSYFRDCRTPQGPRSTWDFHVTLELIVDTHTTRSECCAGVFSSRILVLLFVHFGIDIAYIDHSCLALSLVALLNRQSLVFSTHTRWYGTLLSEVANDPTHR